MGKTDTDERDAWRERNPLRAWRRRHDQTQADVAGATGLAYASMQLWETGARTPSTDALEKLGTLMDRTPASLERAWDRWTRDRPQAAAA